MGSWVFEVPEFNSEARARCDIKGHLKAAMASTKMAVRGNMHLYTGVIEVADFKSEAK